MILKVHKFFLLHGNNFKGALGFGFFHHREPITRNVHCGTCLPLLDLGEVSVVPEEGMTPCEELMVKDVIDPT